MHCLLIGNYGIGNFGDEALKDYFLQRFPEIRWTVLSASPKAGELPRLPLGIRSLFFTPWRRTLRAYRECDAVVFGGGTLFTDVESVRACFLWGWHALAARLFGKKIIFAFQGFGPFHSGLGRRIGERVARRAAFISVRDDESFLRLSSYNLSIEIVQTFDPIYKQFSEYISDRSKNVFVIIPRKNSSISWVENVIHAARSHPDKPVRIVSFEPDSTEEQETCALFLAAIPAAEILPVRSIDDVARAVCDAAVVYVHRYHGALAAHAAGKVLKVGIQREGDKLSALKDDTRSREELVGLVRVGEDALRNALRSV